MFYLTKSGEILHSALSLPLWMHPQWDNRAFKWTFKSISSEEAMVKTRFTSCVSSAVTSLPPFVTYNINIMSYRNNRDFSSQQSEVFTSWLSEPWGALSRKPPLDLIIKLLNWWELMSLGLRNMRWEQRWHRGAPGAVKCPHAELSSDLMTPTRSRLTSVNVRKSHQSRLTVPRYDGPAFC